MKPCTKCSTLLPLSEFSANAKRKDGKASQCKACDKAYKKAYYQANKERISEERREKRQLNPEAERERSRRYYRENREKCLASHAAYRAKNREYIKKWKKKHYQENRDDILAKQKEYSDRNKDARKTGWRRYYYENREDLLRKAREYRENNKERRNEYMRERYRNNAQHNLAVKSRRQISQSLSRCKKGLRKRNTTINLLGCSFEEFAQHIERQFTKGMSWEKVFSGEIHLDHIIPVSSFDLTDPEQQAQAFHYLNVMPLYACDNMEKGSEVKHLL